MKARNTDPVTSHTAAALSARFSDTHKARIMAALEVGPLSTAGVADATGLTVVQVDRRACELDRSGKIGYLKNAMGETVSTDGCRVWVLV